MNSASSAAGEQRKAGKRSNGAFDPDPVEQIRKIRKIERRVAQEERRRVVTARVKLEVWHGTEFHVMHCNFMSRYTI